MVCQSFVPDVVAEFHNCLSLPLSSMIRTLAIPTLLSVLILKRSLYFFLASIGTIRWTTALSFSELEIVTAPSLASMTRVEAPEELFFWSTQADHPLALLPVQGLLPFSVWLKSPFSTKFLVSLCWYWISFWLCWMVFVVVSSAPTVI